MEVYGFACIVEWAGTTDGILKLKMISPARPSTVLPIRNPRICRKNASSTPRIVFKHPA